jgi:riboflavin synthase
MFTGLVEGRGIVQAVMPDGAGTQLRIAEATLAQGLALGASIAVNGVCLTVVAVEEDVFSFQAGPETLRLTTLGELQPGALVNLERSLQVGARLGGHIVQGHIDGVGQLARRERQGEWEMLWFSCPPELTRFMVGKGSIAVDGVSLTLVDVGGADFSVALIPHTLAMTTLGLMAPGARVNLETDLFAKYVAKCFDTMALPRR